MTVDWTGFPVRIQSCLGGFDAAARLLDAALPFGHTGRGRFQEEYLEWRVVRDDEQRIVRVELTTELSAYWSVLAAHHPDRLLALVAEFSGDPEPDPLEVFGHVDPFAPGTTPEQREAGFGNAMLGTRPLSGYNNGRRAICCMVHEDNTLEALVALAAAAAVPLVDATGAPLDGPAAIAAGDQQALDCRGSDPTVVGTAIGLACRGHKIALEDPVGVVIVGVQDRLATPDGTPVPAEWFVRSRNDRRLVLAVPDDAGFVVGDLVDQATAREIAYGGQVADLVQLGVRLRVSDPGVVPVEPQAVDVPEIVPCGRHPACREVVEARP